MPYLFITNMKKDSSTSLLKEAISEILKTMVNEKISKSGKKPGGGLTDLGAWKRISKVKWSGQIRSALDGASGDIEKTADRLEVSPRTVYAALEDEPQLQRAKDKIDREHEDKDSNDKKKYGKDTKPSSDVAD